MALNKKSIYRKVSEEKEDKNVEFTKRDKIISAILVPLIMICSAGLLYFREDGGNYNPNYLLFFFGIMFSVTGTLAFIKYFNKDDILFISAFPILGYGALIILFLNINGYEISEKAKTILSLLAFLLVGLGIFYTLVKKHFNMAKSCTLEIEAKCIYLDQKRGRRGFLYCPYYGFEYNGKMYEVTENFYSNVGYPKIGEMVKIRINPLLPEMFRTKSTDNLRFAIIAFSLLIAIGAGIGIYFIGTE